MGTADDRHNAGRNARGPAAHDRQLGKVQRKILRWLVGRTNRIEQQGTEAEREELNRFGVPWYGVAVHERIGASASAVSTALKSKNPRDHSLRDRGLVNVHETGGKATHVKLTSLGRVAAELADTSPFVMTYHLSAAKDTSDQVRRLLAHAAAKDAGSEHEVRKAIRKHLEQEYGPQARWLAWQRSEHRYLVREEMLARRKAAKWIGLRSKRANSA